MHMSSRSKALRALHGESGLSRRSSRTMWAALLASCQTGGISSVLSNPPPADTSYRLFPPFLFSLIHPIKKHITRTGYGHRYGHSSSPACVHTPRARKPGQKLQQTGKRGRATLLQQHRREKEPSTATKMPFPMHSQQTSPSNTWVQLLAWPQIFDVSSCKPLWFFVPLKHE